MDWTLMTDAVPAYNRAVMVCDSDNVVSVGRIHRVAMVANGATEVLKIVYEWKIWGAGPTTNYNVVKWMAIPTPQP